MSPGVRLFFTSVLCVAFVCSLWSFAEARRPRKSRSGEPTKVHGEGSAVKQATSSNFREHVLDPNVPVLVAFYNTEDTQTTEVIRKSLEEVSTELTDLVEFIYIDGASDDGKQLVQIFGVQNLPALILFNPELVPVPGGQEGQLMKQPLGYEGDGSAPSLLRFVMSSISLNHIERVSTDHELADFFAKFASLDLPRVLYFTEQSSVSPLYWSLSHYYRYGAVFGVAFANNSAELQKRYNVKTFPTLIGLTPSGTHADEVTIMQNLTKETTFEALKAFVAQIALPIERQAVVRPSMYLEEERLRNKEKEHAKMVKALPPVVIKSKKEWVHQCLTRKKGACLAVFLDDVSEDRVPLGMLMNVSLKIAAKSTVELQIVVVDGLHNYAIANHFGMTNGLPDVVVLKPAKRTYMNLIGSVTERGLTNFYLDKALKGSGKAYKAKAVPKFVKTPSASAEDGEISDEL